MTTTKRVGEKILSWIMVASVVMFFLAIALWAGGAYVTDTPGGRRVDNMNLGVYEDGARAYRQGIPAGANPYQGSAGGDDPFHPERTRGKAWLDGWTDAKENAK